jgi:carboxymethylenebutenolidase
MTNGRSRTIDLSDGSPITAAVFLPEAGKGPGLLLCPDRADDRSWTRDTARLFAEEGYVVMLMSPANVDTAAGLPDALGALTDELRALPETIGRIGVLGFGEGGLLALRAAARCWVDCAVAYCPEPLSTELADVAGIRVPVVVHTAGNPGHPPDPLRSALDGSPHLTRFVYPDAEAGFFRKGHSGYNPTSALIAHQRSVVLLRRQMGPHHDFSALWDQHCACEFATRDVDATMATMVASPYVNHIPTMTGGVGQEQLKRFYKYHFIPKTPVDTRLIPVSRTVGETSLVDELLFCFTHDIEMDWMLPGIPPTGRYVEIPLVAIVRFRGDKLYNEHIYWDQASVLVQIGRLDPTGLPVAGAETARKLTDETLPSNGLMQEWRKSEDWPL